MEEPPSTTIVCPVIHRAASPARNVITSAMSSGSPMRPSGSASLSRSSKFYHSALARWVRTMPGATPLTRTPGASSAASWRVRWISAAFVAL